MKTNKCQNKSKDEKNDKGRDKKSPAKARKVAGKPLRYKLPEESVSGKGFGLGGVIHGVREGTGEYGPSEGTSRKGEDSTRPSKLFEGAEQRLTIYIQVPSVHTRIFSGGFLKWGKAERDALFPCIHYTELPENQCRNNIWIKATGKLNLDVLIKILSYRPLNRSQMLGTGASLYYKNTGLRYFNTVTLRPPKCWINGIATSSSRETVLDVIEQYKNTVHSILLSSAFFVYWQAMSNCRDLNPSDISNFNVPDITNGRDDLNALSTQIEEDYISKGAIIRMNNRLTGLVELESLTPAKSKPIIDEIDRVLAKHYGFTDEELDFIINYDIKYRMGRESEEGE